MTQQLFVFRPGESARMLARCQIGLHLDGRCGLRFTYPWRALPWRRNLVREFECRIDPTVARLAFEEVHRLKAEYPGECLDGSQLWADHAEKVNAVTRDATGNACVTVGIVRADGTWEEYYSLRENSPAWLDSRLFDVLSSLMAPHATLAEPHYDLIDLNKNNDS